jgi:hypothetical protein
MPFLSNTFWPQLPFVIGTAPTRTTRTLNELADRITFVFSMPEDAVVDSLYYLQNTLTGGTALTLAIGLQEIVTGTGLTALTWMGAGTAYTLAHTSDLNIAGNAITADNDLLYVKNSIAGIALSRGQMVGLTIQPQAGIWSTTNSLGIVQAFTNVWPRGNLPYNLLSTSIVANDGNQRQQTFMIGSNNGIVNFGDYPVQNFIRDNLHISSQTYDAWGIGWKFPKSWGYTYKICGARFNCAINQLTTSGIGYSIEMLLMDENYNTLQSKTINTQIRANYTTMDRITYYFDDNNLVNLRYGKRYNIALKMNDNLGASNRYMTINYMNLYAANVVQSAFTAADISLILRTDSGGGNIWSEDTSKIPCIDILVK